MNRFGVSDAKGQALERRMARLGIREGDLRERFVRARGPGGQNVNKVATCVVLTHGPSGCSVRAQSERSQALNRFLARRLLVAKLEREREGRRSAEQQRIQKIRRQKRRRSRRAKEKVLAAKRHRSGVKQFRSKSFQDD
ncbi:MAG: peptide chain release factor-like protein [Candidatus Omnitrophica bacterium CG11_big_fil_rev_8_21_14_0_20_64_10]|nr:MAG: peptide chain release factor-like protein [Candidatus Omnitrophica bacterium CG11_big_fil_rev_8_21_14_0_20_64_10]